MLPSVNWTAARPNRTILAIVTVGRQTCAAPIIEICRILHSRGHRIEFACLEGWQKLAAPHDFISRTHTVGRDLTEDEDENLYRVLDASGIGSHDARVKMFQGFDILFSWWTETYHNIKRLCQDIEPGFLFVDELADSAMDVAREMRIPFAGMAPQSPPMGIGCSYISGMPGYQLKHVTNEHAGLLDRVREELNHIKLIVAVKAAGFGEEGIKMRQEAGYVMKPPAGPGKPDHLFFVNSFFGLEVPKELPPMVRPVGPVLADAWPELSTAPNVQPFLEARRKVLYMAFGTHIVTPDERKKRVVAGINAALRAGLIDGVVWAMKPAPAHRSVQAQQSVQNGPSSDEYQQIVTNQHPQWLVQGWLPQRAILDHPSVCVYFAHCGGSSTVEAAFHGVPVLAMPGYGDQFAMRMRLEGAGVAVRLDKNFSSAHDITMAINRIAQDKDGAFARNVLRLRRIAHVNAGRKHLAAQMIEEVMYDHELRFEAPPQGKEWTKAGAMNGVVAHGFAHGEELRPCHLETADMRMSTVKRLNLDLMVARLFYPPLLVLSYVLEMLGLSRRTS